MLGALKSDSVQIASTAAGLALAAYFITDWRNKKKIDPSIDPLRQGADPNFQGGKPIAPHLEDPSAVVPSCEVYDPVSNLFFNLGNVNLDLSKDACFNNVNANAIIRYVDKDEKVFMFRDQLYYPGDEPGFCYFPDQNGKLYTPPSFAAPNQAERLCFNSADTRSMSSFFYVKNGSFFDWNPNVNVASAALGKWSISFVNDIGKTDVDEVQIMTSGILTSPDGVAYSGEAFVRDPSLGPNHQPSVADIDGNRFRRLFLPSRNAVVYFNPNATDPVKKFVSAPVLTN